MYSLSNQTPRNSSIHRHHSPLLLPPQVATMSSFNRKCTLLTQYLKEKGCFGDLSLGNNTLGGLPHVKSMDLFPQQVGFGSHKEDVPDSLLLSHDISGGTRKADTAPMTIFYAGQVLVFDDFPADKAKEVMLLAGRSGPDTKVEAVKARDEPGCIVLPIPRTPRTVTCDLPIARRDSLLRFLEKRKDRITTRASPYQQVKGRSSSSSSSNVESTADPEEKSSWLSLWGQQQMHH